MDVAEVGSPAENAGREMELPWGGQGVSGTPDLLSSRDWAGSLGVEEGEPASGDIPGVRPDVGPANGP